MQHRDTLITYTDHERLRSFVEQSLSSHEGGEDLAALRLRVRSARVVAPSEIPRNVVTMNSQAVLRDLDSGQPMICTLVWPSDAKTSRCDVPVTRPLGTALLGKRVGQIIHWPRGANDRRLRVQSVLYQPEAAGNMHL